MRYCQECQASVSTNVDFCPVCATHVDEDAPTGLGALVAAPEDWHPRRPVLSVAASILLGWATAHLLDVGGAEALLALLFYAPAAVLIVPRVRLILGRLAGPQAADPGLIELLVVGSVLVLYALLVGSAALALYGGAGSTDVVPGSRFALLQAYVAAALLVGGFRAIRRREWR